ncbi:MarR family transcriptional regulator [Bacillus sp. RG28]|uniref:MarR family transcriptional regulator n=1 Tax=Gottfriedia endophytica TaxID=2820819 RepID=A0A940SH54_9BACI|nr:MarR family winged helix-turn-helix transcriptional regulator [Gottfriedia endophytica]MBP0725822.1 MarR family transcriptional regulator [Gottfriedia endophytica]
MIKNNAAVMFSKIRNKVNNKIVLELEKHNVCGIVPSHGDILWSLYQKNGLPIKTIAEKINKTQPTVTVLVNKLEKLGYVKKIKDEKDSRVTLIFLTEKGAQLESIYIEVSDQINEIIYGGLTNDQKEQLELYLEKIYSRF